MYTFMMIFLLVVSSFTGALFLTNSAVNNWLWEQEFKTISSTPASAAFQKRGVYTVSAEEYYLIH